MCGSMLQNILIALSYKCEQANYKSALAHLFYFSCCSGQTASLAHLWMEMRSTSSAPTFSSLEYTTCNMLLRAFSLEHVYKMFLKNHT